MDWQALTDFTDVIKGYHQTLLKYQKFQAAPQPLSEPFPPARELPDRPLMIVVEDDQEQKVEPTLGRSLSGKKFCCCKRGCYNNRCSCTRGGKVCSQLCLCRRSSNCNQLIA